MHNLKVIHLNTLGSFSKKIQTRLKSYVDYTSITKANVDATEAIKMCKDADILIVSPSAIKKIDSSFLKNLPKLKHIALPTVGFDWVDVEYCVQNGISVSTPQGANAEAVAEHVFGLFLDLAKRITEFHIDIHENGEYDFRKYVGTELYTKTLGIIGLGNVGKKVARIAKGFCMNILAFDRSMHQQKGITNVPLKTLLEKSDFISVTIPLDEGTRSLINKKAISKCKKEVIIVNISRKGVVERKAILFGLNKGIIDAYGEDAAIMKPIDTNSPLYNMKNVIILPHNAFNTKETNGRVHTLVADNVIHFVEDNPQNIVEI